MRRIACPSCQQKVPGPGDNPQFPFCSTRCQSVDLGKWLDEGYTVPVDADFGAYELERETRS